ncbi:hypothetical protein K2X85_00170 [bacterium]|nr:hypothetical protein [bacterium]
MRQLALLLSGNDVREPELNRALASQIIAGYSVLFHPTCLAGANFLPEIEDIINPPTGDERLLIVPESVYQAADPIARVELDRAGTQLLRLKPEEVIPGPAAIGPRMGFSTEPTELEQEFLAAGYHYLGLQILLRRLGHSEKIEEQLIWAELSQAADIYQTGDAEGARHALHAAFDVMHGNRQSAYPATINWLDVLLPDSTEHDSALARRWSTGVKMNLVATPAEIQRLSDETIVDLKNRLAADDIEILGGRVTDRPFSFLSFESRAWEIGQSYRRLKTILDRDVDTFAGQAGSLLFDLPQLLMKHGVRYALHAAFDGSQFPRLRGPKIHWSIGDGSIVETVTRPPKRASDEAGGLQIFVDLADVLLSERAPTTILEHRAGSASVWYTLLIEGQKIASVFGKFETVTEFFLNVMMPEGPTVTRPDEYAAPIESLQRPDPISRWRDHSLRRQRFDALSSLLALARIAQPDLPLPIEEQQQLENDIEEATSGDDSALQAKIDAWEIRVAEELGKGVGLLSGEQSGYLIVNPSSFPRRLGIETDQRIEKATIDSTLRACEATPHGSRLLVDLQGWSYAWIPIHGTSNVPAEKLEPVASARRLKNTQIEIEIDKKTGGLRGIWTLRDRYSRLGQQLVHSSASEMIAREIKITQDGSLLGEIVVKGIIRALDSKRELARFEQKFRLWRGRPVARLDITIEPSIPHSGAAMENYFACRWAWPDDKTILLTSSGPTMGSHLDSSIEATDFLELREQHLTTNIVTGGLVRTHRFHRQQADTLLIVPGESARHFTFWIGLDLPNPFRFAQAELWPPLIHRFSAGPPTRGTTGRLASFDSESAHACSMAATDSPQPAVRVRLAETMGKGGRFPFELFRRPESVLLTNFLGETMYDLYREDTHVSVDLSSLELQQLLVLFERLSTTPAEGNS